MCAANLRYLFRYCRYADPDNELSIVVLKNVYDAQLVYDGPGDDTAELFACVRRELLGQTEG